MRPTTPTLLLLALLAAACGGEKPTAPAPAPAAPPVPAKPKAPTPDPAAVEAAAREKTEREAAAKAVEEARRLAEKGDVAAARAALEKARALPGADAKKADEVAAVIDAKEAAAKAASERAREKAAVLRLLGDPAADAPMEERAAGQEAAAAKAREFLAKWPDGDPEGEVADGAEQAESVAKRCRSYLDALARAREALAAKKFADALKAADEAARFFPREEVRLLREQVVVDATPKGMLLVPAGNALLGRKKETTHLRAFYIDRTEVTNAQYSKFVTETGRTPPAGWKEKIPPLGKISHPVVNVSGEDAEAYAAWAGKRLPTEQEWEKAARGAEGRLFPWGDEFDVEKGAFGSKGTRPAGEKTTDASPYGVVDMAGNVMELTTNVLGFVKTARPEDAPKWVGKGGRWGEEREAGKEGLFLRFPFKPGEKDAATGFRCAKDTP